MNKENIINYLKQKKQIFKNKYGIKTIGLYGSYARNEANKDSDLDLFYEPAENFKMGFLEFDDFIDVLKKDLNVSKIDFVNLKNMNPIIKHFAQKDFIYV